MEWNGCVYKYMYVRIIVWISKPVPFWRPIGPCSSQHGSPTGDLPVTVSDMVPVLGLPSGYFHGKSLPRPSDSSSVAWLLFTSSCTPGPGPHSFTCLTNRERKIPLSPILQGNVPWHRMLSIQVTVLSLRSQSSLLSMTRHSKHALVFNPAL